VRLSVEPAIGKLKHIRSNADAVLRLEHDRAAGSPTIRLINY